MRKTYCRMPKELAEHLNCCSIWARSDTAPRVQDRHCGRHQNEFIHRAHRPTSCHIVSNGVWASWSEDQDALSAFLAGMPGQGTVSGAPKVHGRGQKKWRSIDELRA